MNRLRGLFVIVAVIAGSARKGLCAAVEGEKPFLEISLWTPEPVLQGEPLTFTISIENRMTQPFRYMALRDDPPAFMTFSIKPVAGGGQSMNIGLTLDSRVFTQDDVVEMEPGAARRWEARVTPSPELVAGTEYEIVARYDIAWAGRSRLWTGEIVSNPIRITPSAEPVMFSLRHRYTSQAGNVIMLEETVFSLQAGWLTARRGSAYVSAKSPPDRQSPPVPEQEPALLAMRKPPFPDPALRYEEYPAGASMGPLRKVVKLGRSCILLTAAGARGELHLVVGEDGGTRNYLAVSPRGELLRKEVVPATATLLKREDGEVALVEVRGPGPVETPSSGAAGGRD